MKKKKKSILLGLSILLIVPNGMMLGGADLFSSYHEPRYRNTDAEGLSAMFILLFAGGAAALAGTIAGIIKIKERIQLRGLAKKAGVSVLAYRMAADLLDNKEFKKLIQLAESKQSIPLKDGIIQLNKQYFGDDWAQKRKQLLNDYTYMPKRTFITYHSEDFYNKLTTYIKLYTILAKLHGGKILKCESLSYLKPSVEKNPTLTLSLAPELMMLELAKSFFSKDQNPIQKLVIIRGLDRKLGFTQQEMAGKDCT